MKILVINCGSSSAKLTLFDMPAGERLAHCLVEKIGEDGPALALERAGGSLTRACRAANHDEALEAAIEALLGCGSQVLADLSEIAAVGHRVVHGGEAISGSVAIDEGVIQTIRQCIPLAPLHNPANLDGIEAALARLPDRPQVAVFDTAFHRDMPPHAYLYALPYELYERGRVRRYGFHGTSHAYVAERAAGMLGRPLQQCRLITLHLGNGCSAAAVKGGRSIDTSMGLTPLEGLVMGTRCGDVDPALFYFLHREQGASVQRVYELLNRESGLLGLSGASNDMREIEAAAARGQAAAQRALDAFCYRVRKYIGAYFAALGGTDAVVFTAGIGENSPTVRRLACTGLEALGIRLDETRNAAALGAEARISTDDSRTAVLVVPTDEELKIALDTYDLVPRSAD
jgi:acetate kinase